MRVEKTSDWSWKEKLCELYFSLFVVLMRKEKFCWFNNESLKEPRVESSTLAAWGRFTIMLMNCIIPFMSWESIWKLHRTPPPHWWVCSKFMNLLREYRYRAAIDIAQWFSPEKAVFDSSLIPISSEHLSHKFPRNIFPNLHFPHLERKHSRSRNEIKIRSSPPTSSVMWCFSLTMIWFFARARETAERCMIENVNIGFN